MYFWSLASHPSSSLSSAWLWADNCPHRGSDPFSVSRDTMVMPRQQLTHTGHPPGKLGTLKMLPCINSANPHNNPIAIRGGYYPHMRGKLRHLEIEQLAQRPQVGSGESGFKFRQSSSQACTLTSRLYCLSPHSGLCEPGQVLSSFPSQCPHLKMGNANTLCAYLPEYREGNQR